MQRLLMIAMLLAACERADSAKEEPPPPPRPVPTRTEEAFLGVRYVMHAGRVYVDSVLPVTPAERVGLLAGDVIVSLDDKRIETTDELQNRIRTSRPGRFAKLVVERDGVTITVYPRLAAWPKVPFGPAPQSPP